MNTQITSLPGKHLGTVLLSIMLLLSNIVSAQYEDKISVTLPSPNNIFATSYVNTNVNLYSGVPDIQLPIYTLSSKELSIPITLKYKATGVKLHDVASYVGMNWSLQAGGIITRIVRGLPDESEKGYIGKNKTGIQINAGAENDQEKADKIGKGEWDGEPDLFYIITPTQQISFVFDENGVPVFNQPTQLSVSFERTNGIDDNLNIVWYVTDENGVKYTYGATADARETVKEDIPGTEVKPDYISTWYLTTMESFNKTDKITYQYINGPDISTKIYNRTWAKFNTGGGPCNLPETVSVSDYSRTYKAPKYISSITSATTKVSFQYFTNRKDLTNGYALNAISINSITDALHIKSYILGYDYFHPVDANVDRNRLSLKNIYMFGGSESTSLRLYDFKYYVDPILKFPARNSVAYDHWGYFNNNNESTPFVPAANKQPDFNKTVQYTLKSIEHAQGGKTEFYYGLNSYYDNVAGSDKQSGGLRIEAIKEYDNIGNVQTRLYEYKLGNNSSGEPVIKDPKYNKMYSILFPGTCGIVGDIVDANVFFALTDLNGIATGYSRVKVINPNGGYEVSTYTNFSDFPDQFNIINSWDNFSYYLQNMRQIGYPTSFAYKRGLVKTKASFSASNQPVSDIAYDYQVITSLQKKARGISVSMAHQTGSNVSWFQNIHYQPTEVYKVRKETERIYDAENPALFLQKTKEFEYNPNGTFVRKVTYNSSDGQSFYDKMYYPENKSELSNLSVAEDQAYTSLSKLNIPIRTERHWSDNSVDIKYTMYQLKTEGSPAVSKVFPVKLLTSRNNAPFIEVASYTYDFKTGNIITEVAKDGRMNGYFWSTDYSLIAKSQKAAGNEIYYQSFEYVPNAITGAAFSGRKYYSGSYQIPFTRPNGKVYKLSYRRLVNNVWQLVTTNYTTDNMILNEPYPIDDIRINPAGARLNTYTFLPLIGINSACDDNGMIQYFEYDDFQHLKRIRDLNGNITKQLDYKYALDNPFPKVNISIVLRNYYVEEDTPTYYLDNAEAWLVLKDENGNPINNPGVIIHYSLSEERENGTTTTNHSIFFDGSEYQIFSGPLSQITRNTQGTVLQYRTSSFNLLRNIGY